MPGIASGHLRIHTIFFDHSSICRHRAADETTGGFAKNGNTGWIVSRFADDLVITDLIEPEALMIHLVFGTDCPLNIQASDPAIYTKQ